MLKFTFLFLTLSVTLALPALGEPDLQKGKEIFDQMCAGCHGYAGDGGAGHRGGFSPHPSNLAQKEYMDGLTDQYLMLVIKKGGMYVGKIANMPAWEKRLTDAEIRDIIAHIRRF